MGLASPPGRPKGMVLRQLARRYELEVPERPVGLSNLAQATSLIRLLAALLALLALTAIGHALTARRRRRDLAVLRAIGLTGRQLGGSIRSMALVQVTVGVGVGLPIGVVVAAVVWAGMASSINVPDDASVPFAGLAVLAIAAYVATLALAVLPARRAARLPAAAALNAH